MEAGAQVGFVFTGTAARWIGYRDQASGIASVYVDGVMVSSGNRSSVSYRWNTRKAASGSHTISAVARDAASNQTTTSINVTK